MSQPFVSICIPTYNRAGVVGDAIRSALSQTYPALEVLVVDNASGDGTAEVVASFKDPRVRFVRNEENLGLFGNFNRCIDLARGEIIHILNSDDTIQPGFTQACVDLFMAHPDVAMTFTPARMGAGEIHGQREDRIYHPPEGFRAILRNWGLVCCPSVMVRKEIYTATGPFSLEYQYSSDFYQWLRVARKHAIANVGGTYVTCRQGTQTESYRLLFENTRGYWDTGRILTRILEDLGEEREKFTPDMNIAVTRFVKDGLYAMCTRGKQLQGPGLASLTVITRNVWALFNPISHRERVWKAGLRIAILVSPALCRIPGIGAAILTLQGRRGISY